VAAVWLRFRAELRTRWRAWVGLGLLLGVAGGAVIAAAAGARRTSSAYSRFLDRSQANDFSIESFAEPPKSPDAEYAALEGLPGVEASGRYTALGLLQQDGTGRFALPDFLSAGSDGRRFYRVDRPKLLAGRLPARDRTDEAMANRTLAQAAGLEVGDRVELFAPTEEDFSAYENSEDPVGALTDAIARGELPPPEPRRVRITGIGLFPGEVTQDEQSREPRLVLPPAFAREVGPVELWSLTGLQLAADADYEGVRRGIERITSSSGANVAAQVDATRQVERSITPYVTALALFAVLAAIAGVLVIGQALTRQAALDAGGDRTLAALGASPRQRVALVGLRAFVVAGVGALLAIVLAVALSPLSPIGPVRAAEPDPGVAFDAAALALGALALVVITVAWVAVAAWRASRRGITGTDSGPRRTSWLVERMAATGAPTPALTGVRMAVQPGRGPIAVPVRTTIAGAAIAITAVLVVLTFRSGVDRLVAQPALYGWDWDVAISGNGGYTPVVFDEETGTNRVGEVLSNLPGVRAWSVASYGSAVIDDVSVPAVGMQDERGSVHPSLLEGRAPTENDEIVLGSAVLERLGKEVGDTVEVSGSGRSREMRVVGRAVFPSLGFIDVVHTALGDGAMMSSRAMQDLELALYPNVALVRLDDGSTGQAARETLADNFDDPSVLAVDESFRPGEIDAYADLRWTPLLLVGLLALLAVGTLAHALVTATRRRRGELAVLKTVGFTTSQVSATMAWQATTVSVIALVFALPAGLVLGRLGWHLFADELGISPTAVVPVLAIAALVPMTILVANLVAFVPGRIAARLRPAVALRAE
jgi:ABC-type lipoprotein release transport system permease subunit